MPANKALGVAVENQPPEKIPSGWSLRLKTGREAMTSRAVRLYGVITICVGLAPMEMRCAGAPILIDEVILAAIHAAYVASDTCYQHEVAAANTAGEPVSQRDERLVEDRIRKKIVRAFGDLVSIYAADVIVDKASGKKNGYCVYRLPDVYQQQIQQGAKSVYARPGGGRILVDQWGLDIGRQCPGSASN